MSTAPAPPRAAEQVWEQFGTTVVLRLTEPCALDRARAAAAEELDAIDLACSRFRPDSELSRLNAAGGRATVVSALLGEAITLSLRAASLTDGAVDPTIGRAIEICGYDRDWSLLRDGGDASCRGGAAGTDTLVGRAHSDWSAVRLDGDGMLLSLPAPLKLDLGATAKAWAADRAVRAASRAAGCGALVGIGGDLAAAGAPPEQGWPVLVTDDHRAGPGAPGQRVRLAQGGLATSSVTVRRWRRDGREMHHIIDPSSGIPASSCWRTVSVAADSCADANIAATAAIVKGHGAIGWLESAGLPARLVHVSGEIRSIGGWPAEDGAGEGP